MRQRGFILKTMSDTKQNLLVSAPPKTAFLWDVEFATRLCRP